MTHLDRVAADTELGVQDHCVELGVSLVFRVRLRHAVAVAAEHLFLDFEPAVLLRDESADGSRNRSRT
jgi:hypothetical protein